MNTIEEALNSLKNIDESVEVKDSRNKVDTTPQKFKKFEYEVIPDTIGDNSDVLDQYCDIEVWITNPNKKVIDLNNCFLDDPEYAEYVNPEDPDEWILDEYERELLSSNCLKFACYVKWDNEDIEFDWGYEAPEYFAGDYGQSWELSPGGTTVEDVDASHITVEVDEEPDYMTFADEEGYDLTVESACKVLDCSKEELAELIKAMEPFIEKQAKKFLETYLKDYFMDDWDAAMEFFSEPDPSDYY